MDSDDRSPSRGQEADEPTDVPPHRQGVANTDLGRTTASFGQVHRPDVFDEPTFRVGAVHYDDDHDDSVVELTIDVLDLDIGATLSPAAARSLAEQLVEAARFATEGGDE